MTHYRDDAATTPMLKSAQTAYVDELARVGKRSALHKSGGAGRWAT